MPFEAGFLAYAAMANLALASPRHRKVALPLAAPNANLAKLLGIALLALSAIFAVSRFGAYQGPVAWFGMLSVAGVALVLLMSRWPRLALGLWIPAIAVALLCLVG